VTERAVPTQEVEQLQEQIKNLYAQKRFQKNSAPLTLKYPSKGSYTIRTKTYKNGCYTLDCGALNRIIEIDQKREVAIVEPRVTMGALLQATLPYGLIVPVIPELKDITVGGAIMGMAAESASHDWGTFNDACVAFELISGDGTLLRVSPSLNPEIFYGIPGSYGSLGVLVKAEIKLIPAKDYVHLRYHLFSHPFEALQTLTILSQAFEKPDYLDGIIFSKDLAVVIEGNRVAKENISPKIPLFSLDSTHSLMYYQHVKKIAGDNSAAPYEELMTHRDYFFRYDLGAFWMGAYLFHLPLLARLIIQGILHLSKSQREGLNAEEVKKFHALPNPSTALRMLASPFIRGKKLCNILHKAEKWVQNRFVIQDFCIPEKNSSYFLRDVLEDPTIFPIWLLPIKGTNHPQIFAPHLLTGGEKENLFINFGLYGIPPYASPIERITRKLEQKTQAYHGRKTLYSRSYYTPKEFWNIYSYGAYDALRDKMHAKGMWHEITDKVLSV
jgi:hypothetical protein